MRTHTGSVSDLKVRKRLELLRPTLDRDREWYLQEAKKDLVTTRKLREKANNAHSEAQDRDDSVAEDKHLAELELYDENIPFIETSITFVQSSFLPEPFIYLFLFLYLANSLFGLYIKYVKMLTFLKYTEFIYILDYSLRNVLSYSSQGCMRGIDFLANPLLLITRLRSFIDIYIKCKDIRLNPCKNKRKNTEYIYILDYFLSTLYTVLYKYKFFIIYSRLFFFSSLIFSLFNFLFIKLKKHDYNFYYYFITI